MNPRVDEFLVDGCGRCQHYKTPNCKVINFAPVIQALRDIVLECGLIEEYKWSQPCYTHKGNNVLMVSAFKEYAFISFFKGSLLADEKNLLFSPGKSSQASRQFRFVNKSEIQEMEFIIKAYIMESIENEEKGLKVAFKKNPEPLPEELKQKMDQDEIFKIAFEALTPGRQRGYILHFSQAKQSKTRMARIEKYVPNILNGEGIHDNYKKRIK